MRLAIRRRLFLKDANLKAEHIVAGAEDQIRQQKQQMVDLKKQVADFRSQLLDMYRRHLTLIDALPVPKQEEPDPSRRMFPSKTLPSLNRFPTEGGDGRAGTFLFEQRPAPNADSVSGSRRWNFSVCPNLMNSDRKLFYV